MKLNFNFDLLYQSVQEMGAKDRDFTLKIEQTILDAIDVELKVGKPVDKTGIYIKNKLISCEGRQVLLYMQDHGSNIDAALKDGANGRKYHVAYCSTLEEIYQEERFERYVAKNATDGNFFITGFNYGTREHKDGMTKLKVCKNCLKHLNYQGYQSGANQAAIFNNFSLSEFFETYKADFKHKPTGRSGERKDGIYLDNWPERSRQYRASVFWTCESCGLDLSSNKNLLHSHHRNGVKSDNSNSNLQALCIECHARQPKHDMKITFGERETLIKLRTNQKIHF